MSTSPLHDLDAAALATLVRVGSTWEPVALHAVVVLQGLMPDGAVQYRFLAPASRDPKVADDIVLGAAELVRQVRAEAEVGDE